MDCISAGHNDADLGMLVWRKVRESIDEGFDVRVVWPKAHTPLEEKANMALENRQVGAQTGAIQDGAEVAERVAEEALDTREKVHAVVRYAATFHNEEKKWWIWKKSVKKEN